MDTTPDSIEYVRYIVHDVPLTGKSVFFPHETRCPIELHYNGFYWDARDLDISLPKYATISHLKGKINLLRRPGKDEDLIAVYIIAGTRRVQDSEVLYDLIKNKSVYPVELCSGDVVEKLECKSHAGWYKRSFILPPEKIRQEVTITPFDVIFKLVNKGAIKNYELDESLQYLKREHNSVILTFFGYDEQIYYSEVHRVNATGYEFAVEIPCFEE